MQQLQGPGGRGHRRGQRHRPGDGHALCRGRHEAGAGRHRDRGAAARAGAAAGAGRTGHRGDGGRGRCGQRRAPGRCRLPAPSARCTCCATTPAWPRRRCCSRPGRTAWPTGTGSLGVNLMGVVHGVRSLRAAHAGRRRRRAHRQHRVGGRAADRIGAVLRVQAWRDLPDRRPVQGPEGCRLEAVGLGAVPGRDPHRRSSMPSATGPAAVRPAHRPVDAERKLAALGRRLPRRAGRRLSTRRWWPMRWPTPSLHDRFYIVPAQAEHLERIALRVADIAALRNPTLAPAAG